MISPAQRMVAYSFSADEMALLMLRPEFKTMLPMIETLDDGEKLTRAGNRFLLEAQGIKRPRSLFFALSR